MKKTLSVILSLVVLSTTLAGCQKTPDSPIVAPKNFDKMLEAAQNNLQGIPLTEMLNAPERLVLTTTNSSETVTLTADADIIIPKVTGMPTVEVARRPFTQEEADRIIAYFIGTREFNSTIDGYTDDMRRLKQFYEELAAETDPSKRAMLQDSIDKFESAGIRVPQTSEIVPASQVFLPMESGDGEQIKGYSQDNQNSYVLSIQNDSSVNSHTVVYTQSQSGYVEWGGWYFDESRIDSLRKIGGNISPSEARAIQLTITKEDAQEQAARAMSALAIEDMVLYSCDEVWGSVSMKDAEKADARHGYLVRYTRSIAGTPVSYASNEISGGQRIESSEEFIAAWLYESIHFFIDDNGIAEFMWQSPYEIKETVTSATALKPFSEIQDIFSRMMLVTHTYGDANTTVEVSIDITRAELGLMRVMQPNDTSNALLVPVWDFYGSITTETNGQKFTSADPHESYLTINAIDGTIISRVSGY